IETNGSQVGGSNLTTTIDPVGRDTNGGTYTFFLQSVLNNEVPASNVNALTADGLVINAIEQAPNAIGYAALGWQNKKVKALKVEGVKCEPKTISVEPLKYPLSRYLFIVLPGNGTESPPALLKFIEWARKSKLAGEVIAAAGGVPAFNKKQRALVERLGQPPRRRERRRPGSGLRPPVADQAALVAGRFPRCERPGGRTRA